MNKKIFLKKKEENSPYSIEETSYVEENFPKLAANFNFSTQITESFLFPDELSIILWIILNNIKRGINCICT